MSVYRCPICLELITQEEIKNGIGTRLSSLVVVNGVIYHKSCLMKP